MLALAACGSSETGNQSQQDAETGVTHSATLSWDSPISNNDGSTLNNLSGFRVMYGSLPTNMDRKVDITNPGVSRYVIDGFSSGTYYFTVRAVNDEGVESADSNVVSMVFR